MDFKSNIHIKTLLYSLLAVIVFLGLENLLIDFFVLISDVVFEEVTPNIFIDFFFIIITTIVIIGSVRKIKIRYQPSVLFVSLSLIIGFIYLFYRINENSEFQFYRFTIWESVAYLDLLILFPLQGLLLVLMSLFKTQDQTEKQNDVLLSDLPWEDGDLDLLNRLPTAQKIGEYINEYNRLESLSIGILGRWGDGKTSFFNQILKYLDKDKYIIIRFTPWNYDHKTSIAERYFRLFQSELSKYSSEIDHIAIEYLYEIVSDRNPKLKLPTSYLFRRNKSVGDYYYRLNRIVEDIGKRVLVFIDDIDRLTANEIVEVFKIVRNSSNFNNTIFIVGYDRNHINNLISNHSDYKSDLFIDKIFHLEFQLPPINANTIEGIIRKFLEQNIPEYKKEIGSAIDTGRNQMSRIAAEMTDFLSPNQDVNDYLAYSINNIRDVKKLCNSVLLFKDVLNEIDISELFLILILKHRHYSEYLHILNQELLKTESHDGKNRFIIRQERLDELIKGLPKNKKDTVSELINRLFDKRKTFYRSIVFPHNFHLYFDVALTRNISIVEFSKLRLERFRLFQKKLKLWLKLDYEEELVALLNSIDNYSNRQDFENILRARVYFLLKERRDFSDSIINSIDFSKNTNLVQDIYNNKENILKHVLKSIFMKKTKSQSFDNFIHRVHQTYNYIDDFRTAISHEEFISLCLDRFERHLNNIRQINSHTFQYYYRCIESIDEHSKVTISPRANSLFIEKIREQPLQYLTQCVVKYMFPHDGHTYTFEGFLPQVFSGYENFKTFLDGLDQKSEIVSTVQEFFETVKKRNFKEAYIDGDLLKKIQKLESHPPPAP